MGALAPSTHRTPRLMDGVSMDPVNGAERRPVTSSVEGLRSPGQVEARPSADGSPAEVPSSNSVKAGLLVCPSIKNT